MLPQDTFSATVLLIYRKYLSGLEDLVNQLFMGSTIGTGDHSFNITDMMKGGTWVESTVVQNVSELNAKMRKEILARSINELWKTFPSSKMWILFVALQAGEDFSLDTSGPPDSKYCADGGVYYTYNFVEKGEVGIGTFAYTSEKSGGGVDYPWGAPLLEKKTDIPLAVSSFKKHILI